MSSTCFVFKATDERNRDAQGNPSKVALKFMRIKDQFIREVRTRNSNFSADCVVPVLATYPSVTLAMSEYEDVQEVYEAGNILNKAMAEKFFLVVLPLAERNMFVALKQERFAGRDFIEIVHVFVQLIRCVEEMHSKGFLHGDIKPLNIVRIDSAWKLIDLDASCRIGKDFVGMKYSSAYLPPEAVFIDSEQGVASIRHVRQRHIASNDLLMADTSFDVWSLGCLLYQLCHPQVLPLFPSAGQDDNLMESGPYSDTLTDLGMWTSSTKSSKLSVFKDHPEAMNLLAQMLTKDPSKRPPLSRILRHPFLSGIKVARMIGAESYYDVFISY